MFITLVTTLHLHLQAELFILENMKKVHHQIDLETAIIQKINCLLQNDEFESGYFQIRGIGMEIYWEQDQIRVVVFDTDPFGLLLSVMDNKIMDYEIE